MNNTQVAAARNFIASLDVGSPLAAQEIDEIFLNLTPEEIAKLSELAQKKPANDYFPKGEMRHTRLSHGMDIVVGFFLTYDDKPGDKQKPYLTRLSAAQFHCYRDNYREMARQSVTPFDC